jgi:hypothetical protein
MEAFVFKNLDNQSQYTFFITMSKNMTVYVLLDLQQYFNPVKIIQQKWLSNIREVFKRP